MTQDRKQEEIQLVVFKIGNQEYGLYITELREIVKPLPITPIPRAPECIEGVVNLRGTVLAIIDLAKRLDLGRASHSEKTRIIIVEIGEHTVGMIVDEVIEVLRIPQSNIVSTQEIIETNLSHKYITGVGKLEDRLIILINLNEILTVEEIEQVQHIKEKATKAQSSD